MRSTLVSLAKAAQPPTDDVVVQTHAMDLVADALVTLRQDMRRVVAPFERPEHASLFADLMHQRLASHALLDAPSLVHGLAWSAFGWLVGRASVIARARAVKRRHLVTQDIVDAVVPVTFLCSRPLLYNH